MSESYTLFALCMSELHMGEYIHIYELVTNSLTYSANSTFKLMLTCQWHFQIAVCMFVCMCMCVWCVIASVWLCVCARVCFPARVGVNHFVLTELSFFFWWGNNGFGTNVRSVAPCGDAGCCLGASICKYILYVYVYIHIYMYTYIHMYTRSVHSVAPCGDAGCCLGASICKCIIYIYVHICM